MASASDSTSSSRRAWSARSTGGGRSEPSGPRRHLELLAGRGDELTQRAVGGVAPAGLVGGDHRLGGAGRAGERRLGEAAASSHRADELGRLHAASISLCLCTSEPHDGPRRRWRTNSDEAPGGAVARVGATFSAVEFGVQTACGFIIVPVVTGRGASRRNDRVVDAPRSLPSSSKAWCPSRSSSDGRSSFRTTEPLRRTPCGRTAHLDLPLTRQHGIADAARRSTVPCSNPTANSPSSCAVATSSETADARRATSRVTARHADAVAVAGVWDGCGSGLRTDAGRRPGPRCAVVGGLGRARCPRPPEREDPHRRLLRCLWWSSRSATAAGAGTGMLVIGAGGRLAMRLLAVTAGDDRGRPSDRSRRSRRRDISVDGTIGSILFIGLFGGLLTRTPLHRGSPVAAERSRTWLWFGSCSQCCCRRVSSRCVRTTRTSTWAGPAWVSITVYSALALAEGAAVAAFVDRWSQTNRHRDRHLAVALRYLPMVPFLLWTRTQAASSSSCWSWWYQRVGVRGHGTVAASTSWVGWRSARSC